MEVRIDSINEKEIPAGDIFVSMRVGDMQKQSRFSNSRLFRFPENAEGKGPFGRVELFRRIGHATISLDKLMTGAAQELKLPCSPDLVALGQDHIGLRFTTNTKSGNSPAPAPQPTEDVSDPKSKKSRAKARMDAAQKYLQEHRLEDLLAETMREVISAKPSDPRRFIAEKILAEAPPSPTSPGSHSPPVPEVSTPPKASAKAPTSQLFDNFGKYYAENFSSLPLDNLYRKFGAKQAAPAVPPPEDPIESLRKEAASSLIRAAQDGTLKQVLAGAKAVAPQGIKEQAVDIEGLRKEAASSLIRAAQNGTLEKVLAGSTDAAKEAKDLEQMRKEAASALICASQDGSLEKALALARGKEPQAEDEVEGLRKQAASYLLRAANDGTLEKALSQAKGEEPQDARVEELRKHAASSLIRAANDGSLEKALAGAKQPQAEDPAGVEQLRKEAAMSLIRAAQDGTLEKVLVDAKRPEQQGGFSTYYAANFGTLPLESLYSKFPPSPKAGAGAVGDLKNQAATALLRAAGDGSLQELLAKAAGDNSIDKLRQEAASSLLSAAKDGTLEKLLTNSTAKADVEQLRATAASALLSAAQDGTLEKVLAEAVAGEDNLEDLRKEAASSLLRAAEDGTLEKVLAKSQRSADKDEIDDLRKEAASAMLRAAEDGTLERVLDEAKRAKAPESLVEQADLSQVCRTLTTASEQEIGAVVNCLSEGARQKLDALCAGLTADDSCPTQPQAAKAAPKSEPPPAAAMLPWAEYYKANFRTMSPADYQGLYGNFSSKAAAAPAPQAAGAADSQPKATASQAPMQNSPEPAADSRLELLREQAREALLQGARSGSLKEVLNQYSVEDQLRRQARDALLEGAQSGRLVEALKQASTAQNDIELLRQQARDALLQGAASGKLVEALKKAPLVERSIEDLRMQARDALLAGAQSGKLRDALVQHSSDKQEAARDMDELKQRAREALSQGAQSGSLREALQRSVEEDCTEQLRLQAREALLSGAQSGKLQEVLLTKAKASAAPPASDADFQKLPSVGSWLMRHTIFLPGSQVASAAPSAGHLQLASEEVRETGKTAETVLSPESPMAHFVADLFQEKISPEEIEVPDHAAAVELVTAFKAELDKKEDEIERLKAKLAAKMAKQE